MCCRLPWQRCASPKPLRHNAAFARADDARTLLLFTGAGRRQTRTRNVHRVCCKRIGCDDFFPLLFYRVVLCLACFFFLLLVRFSMCVLHAFFHFIFDSLHLCVFVCSVFCCGFAFTMCACVRVERARTSTFRLLVTR